MWVLCDIADWTSSVIFRVSASSSWIFVMSGEMSFCYCTLPVVCSDGYSVDVQDVISTWKTHL